MDRRRFFHRCSLLLSALIAAFLVVPGVAFLADPLRRTRKATRHHRLAKLDDLAVGVPARVVVVDRRRDAWTRYAEGPIGMVWLCRRDEQTVEAFSATCPHLGCQVDFSADANEFRCPCHLAVFDERGQVQSGPAPRGLDPLEVALEQADDGVWVSVVFQHFQVGVAERISLG